MGMTLPPTPKSANFDTISTPFVFNDGFFSFDIPSPSSSDGSPPSFSPPSSGTSSFSGSFPDSPLPAYPRLSLQQFVIWRHGGETTPYLHASSNNPTIRGTVSLEHLDPSLRRYDSVQTAIAELFCPFLHILIPLTVPSTRVVKDAKDTMNSIVTISTPSRSPVRLMIKAYNHGCLTFERKVDMTEEPSTVLGETRYSAALPQEFVDGVCEGFDNRSSRSPNMLDTIAVMGFVQQTNSAQGPYGRTILGLVCDFQAHNRLFSTQVKLSHLSSKITQPMDTTLPPSRDSQPDLKQPGPGFHENPARRGFPKLSVSIPPAGVRPIVKGSSQVHDSSLYPSPDRATPLTGVPQNVYPFTPFDQLIHPPLHHSEHSRSTTRGCTGYGPSSTNASPSTTQLSVAGLMITPEKEESQDSKRARHMPPSRTSPSTVSSTHPVFRRPHTSFSNTASQYGMHGAGTTCTSPRREAPHGYGVSKHGMTSAPPRFSYLPPKSCLNSP